MGADPWQQVAQPQQVISVDEHGRQVADPGQQVIYVDEHGQQVADPGQQVIYVDEHGQQVGQPQPQQMMYAAPQQAVYADPGQQMIYVDEHGQQVAAPGLQYVQPGPSVFNVSHGQFSQIAQGGALTQDQIQTMVGQAPAVASAEQA